MPIRAPSAAALLAVLLGAAAPALAQTRQPPPSPPPRPSAAAQAAAEPERSLAVFGDWAVRCEGRGTARNCEVTQTVQNDRSRPVAVFAIGRLAPAAPMKFVAQLPVNVLLTATPQLVLDGGVTTGTPLPLTWRQCIPNGCYAEADLRDAALLDRLRARGAGQPGHVVFQQAAGGEATLPVSFRGLAEALDALARE